MLRRRQVALVRSTLAVAITVVALAGCGESRSRRDARDGLVEQFVEDGGLPEELANCLVDRYFDAHSDEELATFFDNPEASDAELAEFGALTQECTAELGS